MASPGNAVFSNSDPEAAQKQVQAKDHLHEATEHVPRAEPIERSPHAPEVNTRAAEYDAQAPEVVSQEEAFEFGKYKDTTYVEEEKRGAPKKTLFGIQRRTAYILIAVLLLVTIGSVVGGVLGTQLNKVSSSRSIKAPINKLSH